MANTTHQLKLYNKFSKVDQSSFGDPNCKKKSHWLCDRQKLARTRFGPKRQHILNTCPCL
jgi:hypothetical protein